MATVFTVFVDSRYSVSVGGIFCKMTFWIEDLPLLVRCQLKAATGKGQAIFTVFGPSIRASGGLSVW